MATRRTSSPSSPRAGAKRSQSAAAKPTTTESTFTGSGRYRRTAWAFLILALAAVTGLREWFGVSGAAGAVLHHIAAGPLGVLGVTVPVLLGALGIAMLRVHHLAPVHARVAVGCLGVLAGVTGIIQVVSGNPALSRGIAAVEEAGGLLGWVVGYPLAVLFSAIGAVILFILLIAFSLLVLTGVTVADLRERLSGDSGQESDQAEEEADSLALRLLDRVRAHRQETQTTSLDSYDGDEPFARPSRLSRASRLPASEAADGAVVALTTMPPHVSSPTRRMTAVAPQARRPLTLRPRTAPQPPCSGRLRPSLTLVRVRRPRLPRRLRRACRPRCRCGVVPPSRGAPGRPRPWTIARCHPPSPML